VYVTETLKPPKVAHRRRSLQAGKWTSVSPLLHGLLTPGFQMSESAGISDEKGGGGAGAGGADGEDTIRSDKEPGRGLIEN